MNIPDGAGEATPIHCSNCGAYLGTLGELQDDFQKQIGDAEILDLNNGTITKTS